jgi:hypothetical protein
VNTKYTLLHNMSGFVLTVEGLAAAQSAADRATAAKLPVAVLVETLRFGVQPLVADPHGVLRKQNG